MTTQSQPEHELKNSRRTEWAGAPAESGVGPAHDKWQDGVLPSLHRGSGVKADICQYDVGNHILRGYKKPVSQVSLIVSYSEVKATC